MFIIGLIMAIVAIILYIFCTKKLFHYKEINYKIKKFNEELIDSNKTLLESNAELMYMRDALQIQVQDEEKNLNNLQIHFDNLSKTAKEAYQNYCEILNTEYQKTEQEYENATKLLHDAYNNSHEKILIDLDRIEQELKKLKETRAAVIEAQKKEKEIQNELDYYCIRPSEDELFDIHVLERVKHKLHQPRILCMLIWSTYYQKPMTTLCNNLLGTKEKCGIYKITNQTNNMCYIGQSVDIAKRWKEHAKCGLGIDTPVKNKLYKAMQEDGLENFSWEMLEECSKEDLNEKEKFYIDLYQADAFGYNSNKGIG